jgi:hypothetical protein
LALNKINANYADKVLNVQLALNSEAVLVEVKKEFEEECAKEFFAQYGALVLVINDTIAVDDTF